MTINRGIFMMGVGRVAVATISMTLLVVVMMMMVCKEGTRVSEPGKRDFFATGSYRRARVQRSHDDVHDDERPPSVMLSVNTTTTVATVDKRFVSVGATMGFTSRPDGQNFNSTRFWTLARGLSPALYRLGGAEADFTIFKENVSPKNCTDYDTDFMSKTHPGKYGKLLFFNMTFCAHTWDNMNEFARSVGWDILFTLNGLHRNGSSWDPSNAIQLLNYTKQRGYQVIWALGNEPNGYSRKDNVTVTAAQMAQAYHTLRKSIAQIPDLRDVFLIGPDTSAPIKKLLTASNTYLDEFLHGVGTSTNATSFHFYYTSGRTAGFRDLTDPHLADLLPRNIQSVQQSVAKYGTVANSKIWITESGIAFGSGPRGLNNVYLDGFFLLDKLGMSARLGVHLIVQQGLIGKNGGLFDENFNPHMTYWLLLYHKRLMGTRVLDVSKVVSARTNFNFTNYIRIYAHCTKTSSLYQPGSVTLMIINMGPINDVHIHLEGALLNTMIHEYLFLPRGTLGILSRGTKLNGQPLQMDDDYTLPYPSPREQPPGSMIVVPQQSYGFYVLPNANVQAPACQ